MLLTADEFTVRPAVHHLCVFRLIIKPSRPSIIRHKRKKKVKRNCQSLRSSVSTPFKAEHPVSNHPIILPQLETAGKEVKNNKGRKELCNRTS